jgi:hypothetical protein
MCPPGRRAEVRMKSPSASRRRGRPRAAAAMMVWQAAWMMARFLPRPGPMRSASMRGIHSMIALDPAMASASALPSSSWETAPSVASVEAVRTGCTISSGLYPLIAIPALRSQKTCDRSMPARRADS